MDMTIVYGVGMFTAIVLALVGIILYARTLLVSSGNPFTLGGTGPEGSTQQGESIGESSPLAQPHQGKGQQ